MAVTEMVFENKKEVYSDRRPCFGEVKMESRLKCHGNEFTGITD